jgi:hypothetical protein
MSFEELTIHERQFLRLYASGKSLREIADELGIHIEAVVQARGQVKERLLGVPADEEEKDLATRFWRRLLTGSPFSRLVDHPAAEQGAQEPQQVRGTAATVAAVRAQRFEVEDEDGLESREEEPVQRKVEPLAAAQATEPEHRDPIYGPRLSEDIDELSSTIGWAPWMRLFRRHEQRLIDRRRAAREPRERGDRATGAEAAARSSTSPAVSTKDTATDAEADVERVGEAIEFADSGPYPPVETLFNGRERLEDMTREQLYQLAQARDVKGRTSMSKDELRAALREQ